MIKMEITGNNPKKIKRERLMYLMDNISIMTEVMNQAEDTLVLDDPVLTENIEILKQAIKKFSINTGLKLSHLGMKDKQ